MIGKTSEEKATVVRPHNSVTNGKRIANEIIETFIKPRHIELGYLSIVLE